MHIRKKNHPKNRLINTKTDELVLANDTRNLRGIHDVLLREEVSGATPLLPERCIVTTACNNSIYNCFISC